MNISASTVYVLILISHANDGTVLGTSQARFDTLVACKAAGKASEQLGGKASWGEDGIWTGPDIPGTHKHGEAVFWYGLHNRIEFQCVPAKIIEAP